MWDEYPNYIIHILNSLIFPNINKINAFMLVLSNQINNNKSVFYALFCPVMWLIRIKSAKKVIFRQIRAYFV